MYIVLPSKPHFICLTLSLPIVKYFFQLSHSKIQSAPYRTTVSPNPIYSSTATTNRYTYTRTLSLVANKQTRDNNQVQTFGWVHATPRDSVLVLFRDGFKKAFVYDMLIAVGGLTTASLLFLVTAVVHLKTAAYLI